MLQALEPFSNQIIILRLLLSIYALYKYIESLSIVICIFLCNLYILWNLYNIECYILNRVIFFGCKNLSLWIIHDYRKACIVLSHLIIGVSLVLDGQCFSWFLLWMSVQCCQTISIYFCHVAQTLLSCSFQTIAKFNIP